MSSNLGAGSCFAAFVSVAMIQPTASVMLAAMKQPPNLHLPLNGLLLVPALILTLILILLAVMVGLSALAAGLGALPLPYELHLIKLRMPYIFTTHMLASGLALLLTPCVLASVGGRLHTHLGRITAALVAAGGLSSLPVAFASVATPAARIGFFAQGLAWLAFNGFAWAAIRRKDRARHGWAMLAMAAVASGAVWLRLATVAAVRMQLPFDLTYAIASWVCWLAPLTAVTLAWWMRNRRAWADAVLASGGG